VFCSHLGTKPIASQICNSQSCGIQITTDIDDWGQITPCDQNGTPTGPTRGIPGNCQNQQYLGYTWTAPVGPLIGGYYYYRIQVDDVHGGRCGGFRLDKNGVSCELVQTLQGNFTWLDGGFCCGSWCHHGKWFRCYRTTAIGIFRIRA
jgi:hypothetical protein